MLIGQHRDSFQFDDYLLEANVIWCISLLQYSVTIAESERWFRDCRNTLVFQLDAQALLIDRLQKPTALLVIYLEAGANDRVALAFVNDFCHLFALIRVIRGYIRSCLRFFLQRSVDLGANALRVLVLRVQWLIIDIQSWCNIDPKRLAALVIGFYPGLFFFSSRRRHTISTRDWSSDVCSSN